MGGGGEEGTGHFRNLPGERGSDFPRIFGKKEVRNIRGQKQSRLCSM